MTTPTFQSIDAPCGPIDAEIIVAAVLIFIFNAVATLLHTFNENTARLDIVRTKTKMH